MYYTNKTQDQAIVGLRQSYQILRSAQVAGVYNSHSAWAYEGAFAGWHTNVNIIMAKGWKQ